MDSQSFSLALRSALRQIRTSSSSSATAGSASSTPARAHPVRVRTCEVSGLRPETAGQRGKGGALASQSLSVISGCFGDRFVRDLSDLSPQGVRGLGEEGVDLRGILAAGFGEVEAAAASAADDRRHSNAPGAASGILDSLGTLNLVSFLEAHFGIQIEAHETGIEHFDRIRDIAALVGRKRPAGV